MNEIEIATFSIYEDGWSDGYHDCPPNNEYPVDSPEYKAYEKGYEDGCNNC